MITILGTYLGVLGLILIDALVFSGFSLGRLGNTVLFVGVAMIVLAFLLMGATHRFEGAALRPQFRNDENFRNWHKLERPIGQTAWAMVVAGGLLAGTGFLVVQFSIG